MHLVVQWKENINLHLSITDLKDRAEDCFLEQNWLNLLKKKIIEKDYSNKTVLLDFLNDLELTKTAFKNSLADLKISSNDILKKYNNFTSSEDEKMIMLHIDNVQRNRKYSLKLDSVFCIDNESTDNRLLAINKSERWIEQKLVNYDFEIRDYEKNIIYSANEITEIEINKHVALFMNDLIKDFEILKQYNQNSIALSEYRRKREVIPEILSRTEGLDSFLKHPSEISVAALSTILIEKKIFKKSTISQYKKLKQ